MVMNDTQFWISYPISAFLAVLIVKPIATKVLRRFGMDLNKDTPFVIDLSLALIVSFVMAGIFYLIRFLLTGATDRATLFQ
jgi:hypothetical protein